MAIATNVQDVSGLPRGAGRRPRRDAAAGRRRRRLRRRLRRQLAPLSRPSGLLAAVKYLVEETGADVNAADHEGNTALHHAAARGDNEMIKYLVSKGADVTRVNREGQTTADMANGPVQRTQPFPETHRAAREASARRTTTSACPVRRLTSGALTPMRRMLTERGTTMRRTAGLLCGLVIMGVGRRHAAGQAPTSTQRPRRHRASRSSRGRRVPPPPRIRAPPIRRDGEGVLRHLP